MNRSSAVKGWAKDASLQEHHEQSGAHAEHQALDNGGWIDLVRGQYPFNRLWGGRQMTV